MIPGLPEWITNVLRDNGLAGAVIFVLLLTVVILGLTVKSLYGHNQKVYGFRLAERDVLNKALTDAAAAINAMKEVTDERNEITDDLAVSFKLLAQKVESNHNSLKEEVARNGLSISTAATIYAKMVDDMKQMAIAVGNRKHG